MLKKLLSSAKWYYDFVKEGIVLCDAECRIRFVNAAASNLLQQSSKALVGKNLSAICAEESIEKIKQRRFYVPKGLVLSFHRKDGPAYKTRVIATPLIKDNVTLGMMLMLRNNEAAIQLSQQQFMERNAALNAIGQLDGQVCIVSDLKAGAHVFVSASVERLIGWTASNFLNGGWAFASTIFNPDDLVEVQRQMQEGLENYRDINYNAPYRMRYHLRHKNGRWVKIEERGCLLERDTDGSPRYMLAFVEEAANGVQAAAKRFKLTQRETEVADGILRGLSSRAIAEELSISVYTVNDIRKHLLRKTQSPNTAALVKTLDNHFA